MTTTVPGIIVVLDPTAQPRELRHTMAPRRPDIRGLSVGFLWNSKPNGDILFARLEELLREKYEVTDATYRRKPTSSVPAAREMLDELATSVDVAIVGLGD
ncbi:MAG TPA: hypothetical protein VFA32_18550 [Dehalococcoidia bacterium]|nr:hypothetical protein [Dehalococcoidia bacterium]